MKRMAKSVLGVTLLEIMLVLAIASMIIVMSVRYYQAATTAQQTSAMVQQILAISTAMDSLGTGSGSYSAITSANVIAYLGGASALMSPINTQITISNQAQATYKVSIPLSSPLCAAVVARLSGNAKFGLSPTSCSSAGTLTYTYNKAS
jgi:type II secretory pathway pseudopilin PulG